ncbi:hypothetical protein Efla_000270 [Eimeria flavescens]
MDSPAYRGGARGVAAKQDLLAAGYGSRLLNGSGGQAAEGSDETPSAALLRLTLLQLQRVLTQNAALSDALREAVEGEEKTSALLRQHKTQLDEAAARNSAAALRARSLMASELHAAHKAAQEARDAVAVELKKAQQEAADVRSLMAAELAKSKQSAEELRDSLSEKLQKAEKSAQEARAMLTAELDETKKKADESRKRMREELENVKKMAAQAQEAAAAECSELRDRERILQGELQKKDEAYADLNLRLGRQQEEQERELQRLASVVAQLQGELQKREEAAVTRDGELEASRQQIEGSKKRVQELEDAVRTLEEEAAQKDRFLESALAEKDLTFQQQLQQQEEKIRAKLSRREAELAKATAEHQEALQQLQQTHLAACQRLSEEMRTDASRSVKALEEQLQQQTSAAADRLAQLSALQEDCKRKEAALAAAQREAAEEKACKEEQTKAAEAAMAALRDGMMLKEQELQQLHQQQQAELQKQLEAKDRNLVEVLMRREAELQKHREETELLNRKLQAALSDLAAVRAQQAAAKEAAEQQTAEVEKLHGLRKQMERKLLQMQIEGRRAVRPRAAAVAVVLSPEQTEGVQTPRQPGKQRRKEAQLQVEWADQAELAALPPSQEAAALKRQAEASSAGHEPRGHEARGQEARGQEVTSPRAAAAAPCGGLRGRRPRASASSGSSSVGADTHQDANTSQISLSEHSQGEAHSQGSSKTEEFSAALGEDACMHLDEEPQDAAGLGLSRRHSSRLRKNKVEASPSTSTPKPSSQSKKNGAHCTIRTETFPGAGNFMHFMGSTHLFLKPREMGKKRGGRRHRAKKSNEPAAAADAEQPEAAEESVEAEVDVHPTEERGGRRRNKPEVSEYFAHIKQLIDDCPFQGNVQFEAFITSTVEEIHRRGLLVISDPKCSRVVEKLIALLANFIAFEEGGRRPTFDIGGATEEEKLQSRLRCLDSYLSLLRAIAPVAPDMAGHPNASHVLQTLLNSVPAVIEFERKQKKEAADNGQTVEDLFLFMFRKLRSEGGGWLRHVSCATGTHIFRSAVRAVAGIDCLLPAEAAGHRSRRKTRRDCEETLASPQVSLALSAVLGKAGGSARLGVFPQAFKEELNQLAEAIAAAVEDDPFRLPFGVYAAPSLQVLMLALHARKQGGEAKCVFFSLLITLVRLSFIPSFSGSPYALVDSPTGSRILEVALPLLTPERFQLLFAHWILKKISDLAQGRFGNFVLQKVLQASVFQAAHLKQFVHALDFTVCLSASTSAVLWRCAEACRRLQASFKEFAKKMFEAVGVKGGSSTPYVWWCLLGLCTPEDLPGELLASLNGGNEDLGQQADCEEEEKEETTEGSSSLQPACGIRLQDICTPSGCSIVTSLLSFPAATIQPLNAGFKKFIKVCRNCKIAVKKWKGKGEKPDIEFHPLLELMATSKLASRVIQQIADPATVGIQQAAVQHMIRSLLPFVPSFAVDPVGGFVLTSIYSGATPPVKQQIVEALLPVEEELKAKNYAAYMKCEIYRFTKNKEEWQARQEKRSKTRNLFKDILATPAAEADGDHVATPNSQIASVSCSDPFVKQLVLDEGQTEAKGAEQSKKKKRRKNGEEATDLQSDTTPHEAEAAREIQDIFLEAFDEKQQTRKKKRSKKTENDVPGEKNINGKLKDPKLEAALFFIEGTNDSLSKRERARRRKLEASGQQKHEFFQVEKLAAAESHKPSGKKTKASAIKHK